MAQKDPDPPTSYFGEAESPLAQDVTNRRIVHNVESARYGVGDDVGVAGFEAHSTRAFAVSYRQPETLPVISSFGTQELVVA